MATKVPGWLKVVVTVCGVAVILGVGLAVGSFLVLRSSLRQFEAGDRSFDVLAERYGAITSYRPEPDGIIRAERLEAFLAAREKIRPRRERVANALMLLSDGDPDRRGGVLPKIRGSVGLLRNLAPFHRERNEALMEAGIGLGEYYYLYALAYYSWLGKSPGDGPPFKIVSEKGYLLETIESLEEPVVREYRTKQARLSLNRLLLPVLRSQLAVRSPDRDKGDSRAWEQTLASEIAALEADAQRLPWENGLPVVIEQSLLPYRDRLSDSYDTMCNAIEIGLARRSPNIATREADPGNPDA